MAALPVAELRASIPYGIWVGLPPLSVLVWSILGSVLPVFPFLALLSTLTRRAEKIPSLSKLLDQVFERTRAKSDLIKRYEAIGLVLFIAVPLPGTGVWTGTLAGYLFGLKKRWIFLAALTGSAIAGIIMTAGTLGVFGLSDFLKNRH